MSIALPHPSQFSVVHQVLSNRLREVREPKFDGGEFRLSESGKCARYRVAKVLGMAEEAHDETDAGYFERGHLIERWVVEQFRAAFPRRCRTQQTVITPFGDEGHIDLWFPAEARIIEVKSISETEQELPRRDHFLQTQAYMHFLKDKNGDRRCNLSEIVYVKYGRELHYQVCVIEYDPAVGQQIEDDLRRLHQFAERYELPDIPQVYEPFSAPCTTFYTGEPKRCAMWEHCWLGSKRAPALEAPEVVEWVSKYAELKNLRSDHTKQADALRDEMGDLEVKLAAIMDIYGTKDIAAGGKIVSRTMVEPKPKFDSDAAIAAGAIPDAVIAQYIKQPNPYARWYVKKAKGEK